MTEKLGFIGLGIMGLPMALNLRRAGYTLAVFNRNKSRTQALHDLGAAVAVTPRDVAAGADIVFICVSDTPDVEDVIFGPHGLIEGAKKGQVFVDMSTISPEATKRFAAKLAEKGVALLDAPVSGGESGAVAGSLSIMVGGDAPVFARVKPYFEKMGKNIVHVGATGAGQIAKACNQVIIAVTIEAVGEALLLAQKSGVDAAKVREALMGGFAGSKVLEVHGKRMLDNDFRPGFKAKLHRKDMGIVLETAKGLKLPLPATTLTTLHLDEVIKAGDGELDSSAIFKVLPKS